MKDGGLIHIYTGTGKGKTTAALGLAVRASGRGNKVLWTSFLKDYDSGEFLLGLPFEVFRGEPVTKFVFSMTEDEKKATREEHEARLKAIFDKAAAEKYDMIVLDETLGALAMGMLGEELVLELLAKKPAELEVVLTGRDPSEKMKDACDYLSEITAVKHPYEKGVPARIGVEW